MRSVERVAGKREVKVVRDAARNKDAELTRAISSLGYAATVVPTTVASFRLDGLSCAGCLEKARTTLMQLKGVRISDVDKTTQRATVQFESRTTTSTKIKAALRKAGFPASA